MVRSAGRAVFAIVFSLTAFAVQAENLRIAAFNAELTRRNPGLLVRDLMKGKDPQVEQVVEIIQTIRPDVLLVSGVDYDIQELAIGLLREALAVGLHAAAGIEFPYWYVAPVNTGVPSGLDLNGDGRPAAADDAWGFGYFPGQEGMVVLSRFPIDRLATRTFQTFRWQDLPDADLPVWYDGTPWPSAAVQMSMRLSSASHWDVVVSAPGGDIHLLAAHPTPPVFDGLEDANGKRNHDEIAFWTQYLNGAEFKDDQGRAAAMASGSFVVMGDFNADPLDGDGMHDGIGALLGSDRLRDPEAKSAGGSLAAAAQLGANVGQIGDPAMDTADWPDESGKPGNMRVDLVLPSIDFAVEGAGVFWPTPDDPLSRLIAPVNERGARHRLVWVDVSR